MIDITNIAIADQDFDNKVLILKKHLKSRMNGKATEQMENGQLDYAQNYGVSLQHIKELAAQLNYSADDCIKFWRLNIREALLIAAICMPTNRATSQEMISWVKYIHTPDMAEQASFFLFWRTTDIDSLIDKLTNIQHEYALSIASFSLGRAIQRSQIVSNKTITKLISFINNKETLRPSDGRGVSLFLRQIARNSNFYSQVQNTINTLSTQQNNTAQQVAFEVQAELDLAKITD